MTASMASREGKPCVIGIIVRRAMPELPEVETIVRDLRGLLVGRTIEEVVFGHPSVIRHPDPASLRELLVGAHVEGVERRGKYIVVHLRERPSFVVHLG